MNDVPTSGEMPDDDRKSGANKWIRASAHLKRMFHTDVMLLQMR